MGNTQNQPQTKHFIDNCLNDFDNQTYFIEQIEDFCFGQIKIYKRKHIINEKTSNLIMEKLTQSFEKVEYAHLYYES